MACLSPAFQQALSDTVSDVVKRDPKDAEIVPTKRFGKAWKIDGIVVVLDPRFGWQKVLLRADRLKESVETGQIA